jgi:hypothetical protein
LPIEENHELVGDSIKFESIQKTSDDAEQFLESVGSQTAAEESTSQTKKSTKVTKVSEYRREQEQKIAQLCKLECHMCAEEDLIFERWQDMKRHYRTVHQTDGYAICLCCNRSFFSRTKVLEHVEWKLNPDIFKCETCGKCLVTRDGLREHMVSHEPNDSRLHKCSLCSKTFVRHCQFLEHQLHHLPDSEKTYVCTECKRR